MENICENRLPGDSKLGRKKIFLKIGRISAKDETP